MSQLVRLTRLQPNLSHATSEEKESFKQWLISLEHNIATYVTKAATESTPSRNELIREVCCISSCLYTKLELRKDSPNSPEVQSLRSRLGFIFMSLDTKFELQHQSENDSSYLLWMLLTGAMLCKATRERNLFVAHITSVVTHMQIATWDEVYDILRGYMWTDTLFIQTCKKIWEELEVGLGLRDVQ